ncbi:lycopene cyclase domain-containing protein [Nocardioides sp. cx-173]|uniref:lycopene cyclase domain-containing protein n=1 Tax=Nocardioides sp. cx-173 TaxID=2898796 RepID=UPI001E5BA63F|nr:lycopene cyclase domain-containing protein [Nocardioides sp. cx-173]MCD4527489.1 lycopene cyclase domain-containing protein [Nocardioides sp. cx-173]UGB43173.1 lycopene cyclase domain-containing protein [Nocardioides sp. cx-173]
MRFAYLASILVSALCLGLVDRRWRLFLFARPLRALAVLAVGFAFFLVWDLAALDQAIYRRGDSPAMTGIEVADELPVEELFFIGFLCYTTMVLHGLAARLLSRRREGSVS